MFVSPPSECFHPPMRVDSLTLGAVSDHLIAAWTALVTDAAEPNSFMEHWFVVPSLAYLGNEAAVRLVAVWCGERLIGLIAISTSTSYGRIAIRHTVNWQSVQCFYGAPLIRRGDETQFWTVVLDHLDAADWAPNFLRVMAIEEHGPAHTGLLAAAVKRQRACPTIHRHERAFLSSTLSPDAYLDHALRGKKRKELRRLTHRLDELGTVTHRRFEADDDLDDWIADFLLLEAAGWKGSEGAAFANTTPSEAFFRAIIAGAHDANTLDMLRIDVDGRAIAMLINFIRPPGSYSFKIAYDETFARFSPGVMIEIDNLKSILTDLQVEWMDSCAHENHPMINGLWMERRTLVQVSVPLKGLKRRIIYGACRLLESLSASYRNRKTLWSRA